MINSILFLVVLSVLTHASCIAPSCPSSVESCSSTPGCWVSWAETPTCSFQSTIECYAASQSSCTMANGCIWMSYSGGRCSSKGACSGLSGDACTNAGCQWEQPRSYCYHQTCNYGEAQCKDASNGCQWHPNYCAGPDWDTCRAITTEDKCKKEDTGCEWRNGQCEDAWDLNCFDNDAGTGCNTSSDTGCWWKGGYCTYGSNHCSENNDQTSCNNDASKVCEWRSSSGYCGPKCNDNDADTGCAAGVPAYCQWETFPGECYKLNNVYCQTTKNGSECTAGSDARCSHQAATTESCGPGELLYECPFEGDSCSEGALEDGCVNNSAAFIIRTPLTLVFAAVLSIFFFVE